LSKYYDIIEYKKEEKLINNNLHKIMECYFRILLHIENKGIKEDKEIMIKIL
jgi:hypothetical protein